MADTGDQSEWNRVNDVGSDNLFGVQSYRVEEHKQRRSKRSGTNRRKGNEHSKQRTRQDGQRQLPLQNAFARAAAKYETVKHRAREGGDSGGNEDQAERRREPTLLHLRPVKRMENGNGHHRTWNASDRQSTDDFQISAVLGVMDGAPNGLRNRGEQQVGTDRCGRRYPENQDQDRRHERAAADARDTDKQANKKSGKGV
jgi:hypothetical protein